MLGSLKIHLKARNGLNGLKGRNNSLNDRFQTIIRFFVSKCYKYIFRTARVSSLRDHKHIKLLMNPNCTISEKCFVVGLYDKDLMLFLKEFIGHDDLFFDVGANVGPFSLICSDAGAKVVAFEGHPKTGSILRDNFSLNNINPELVVNVAISSESGFVKFLDDPGSAVNSVVERDSNLSELSVKSVKLDDMADLFGCPSYVKIDTEGHEFSVFKGMKKILGHCKPKLISFEANGLSSLKELQGIHDLLSANGYLVGNIDYKSREFVISKCLGGKSAVGDYHACSKSFIDLILKESFLIKES